MKIKKILFLLAAITFCTNVFGEKCDESSKCNSSQYECYKDGNNNCVTGCIIPDADGKINGIGTFKGYNPETHTVIQQLTECGVNEIPYRCDSNKWFPENTVKSNSHEAILIIDNNDYYHCKPCDTGEFNVQDVKGQRGNRCCPKYNYVECTGAVCTCKAPSSTASAYYTNSTGELQTCDAGEYVSCNYTEGLGYVMCIGGSPRDVKCQECPEGHVCPGGVLKEEKCKAGTYVNEEKTACIKCPVGNFCPGDVSNDPEDGIKDLTLAAMKKDSSYYQENGFLTADGQIAKYKQIPCPKGFYSDQENAGYCQRCDPGRTTSDIGSTAKDDCDTPVYNDLKFVVTNGNGEQTYWRWQEGVKSSENVFDVIIPDSKDENRRDAQAVSIM